MSVAMVTPIGVPSSQKDQALHVYVCGNGGHHFPSLREMKKKKSCIHEVKHHMQLMRHL